MKRELAAGPPVVLRRAMAEDLPALVLLLADDGIGGWREGRDLAPYAAAIRAIDADPAQLLVAAVDGGEIMGTLQLTVVPGLARGGALRGQLKAVRVASSRRGSGLGAALVGWAVGEARRRGCALVQLTTDKRRTDAHRFYERLGFVASHEGFTRELRGRPGNRLPLVPGRRIPLVEPGRVDAVGAGAMHRSGVTASGTDFTSPQDSSRSARRVPDRGLCRLRRAVRPAL